MIGPVLVTSDLNKKIKVEADVLDFSMGRVLSMKYKNKRWRLVAYILKSLNKAKRNYKIYNKLILAIIRCLEV